MPLPPPKQFERREGIEKLEKKYSVKVIEVVKPDVDLWEKEK